MSPSFKRNWFVTVVGAAFLIHATVSLSSSSLTTYAEFATFLKSLILDVALISLCIVMVKNQHAYESTKPLLLSFWIVLGIIVAQALYINPSGIFPWNQMPFHVTGGVRPLKLALYEQLPEKPEIIILGSSRAQALSAGYLSSKLSVASVQLERRRGRSDRCADGMAGFWFRGLLCSEPQRS